MLFILTVPYSWNPCCFALVFTEQFQKVVSLCLRVLHRYVPWRLHGEQKHSKKSTSATGHVISAMGLVISAMGHVISAMGHVISAMGHVINATGHVIRSHVGNLPLHWH